MPSGEVRRRRWRIVAALTPFLVVPALAIPLASAGWIDLTKKPGVPEWAGLLVTVGVLVGYAIAVFKWALRQPAPAPTDAMIIAAKTALAGLVQRQWKEEARIRALGDPQPIPVAWQLTSKRALMDHPQLITGPHLGFSGTADDIDALAGQFRALRSHRLVITGGPGTGKTTLALQLLLQLLASRTDPEPIPVMLSIAGWDTARHPRLGHWMADQLAVIYPTLRAAAYGGQATCGVLVEEGHVLPVLDGLDELPAPARAQVIRALNESFTEGDQLILTSRTTEFATAVKSAGDVVTAAAVIAPVALTPPVAATYLRTCLPPEPCHGWEPVLATIDSGSASALAAVTATPLGLWLIRMVYVLPGADPAPLLGPLGRDPAALRRHLLDQLIDALIRARPPVSDGTDPFRPRRAWDPGQARTWLGHLAQALTRNHTRDLAWWSIARYITTSPRRRLLQVMIGLVVGTVTLLVLSVHGVSDQAASVLGLGAGISAGIWAGFVAKRWFQESPGSRRLPIRKLLAVLVRVLVAGLATWTVTLLVAVMVALLVIVMGSEALLEAKGTLAYQFMEVVLWLGFLTGLAAALIVWSKGMERPAVLVSTSTPISVWQADRNLSLARILAAGVMFGLVFFVFDFYAALAFRVDLQGKPQPGLGLADALVQGFASGLTGLLVGALVGGLVGRHHAWLLYVLVVRTASTIHLPAKLMPFLDDMHRLGLLRTVGPHYQFRHAELQDHLAPAPSPDGDPQQAAGTAPSRRISF